MKQPFVKTYEARSFLLGQDDVITEQEISEQEGINSLMEFYTQCNMKVYALSKPKYMCMQCAHTSRACCLCIRKFPSSPVNVILFSKPPLPLI